MPATAAPEATPAGRFEPYVPLRDESRRDMRRRREPPRRGLARRHPGAIAIYVVALALATLMFVNPLQTLAVLAVLWIVLLGSGRVRAAMPYLKTGLYIGLFMAIVNALVSRNGSTVFWDLRAGPVQVVITLQGVAYGVAQALRIIALITAFALLTLVLDPDDQLGIMSRLSFRGGLVISLAFRLLPVLSRDAARVRDAQRARGLELDAGRRRTRAAAHVPLLSALLVQALERAIDVAASMEARGFGARTRSRWAHGRRWQTTDAATTVAALLGALALVCGLAVHAYAYNFYPLLDDPLGPLTSAWWLLAVIALAVPALWALLW